MKECGITLVASIFGNGGSSFPHLLLVKVMCIVSAAVGVEYVTPPAILFVSPITP